MYALNTKQKRFNILRKEYERIVKKEKINFK
jgi:hypothetical protein